MTRAGVTLPGVRRGGATVAVALFTATFAGVPAAPARAADSRVAANHPLVVLHRDAVARTGPSAGAPRIESVSARRPLTGVRTVLPVLGEAVAGAGGSWVPVDLPGRPNGHHGWIPADGTTRTATKWQISLKLSARRVTVYHGGSVRRRFRAVVGKSSTPTPRGRFFIEEAFAVSSRDAGGPFALATSSRSSVLQEFNGGPGQIGLHGTNNLPGALGTAASHGCVRLSPAAITWIARRIDAGVPLTITR